MHGGAARAPLVLGELWGEVVDWGGAGADGLSYPSLLLFAGTASSKIRVA